MVFHLIVANSLGIIRPTEQLAASSPPTNKQLMRRLAHRVNKEYNVSCSLDVVSLRGRRSGVSPIHALNQEMVSARFS